MLADQLSKAGEPSYAKAFERAHERILGALRNDGIQTTLPSRANGEFEMTFRSRSECRDWSLEDGNKIPSFFWWCYHEAEKEQLWQRDNEIRSEVNFVGGTGECFEFRLSSRDDGILQGHACQVEVLRASIPGLPKSRGRVPGYGKKDDTAAINFAIAQLDAGQPWRKVIPKAVDMMEGNSRYACRTRLVRVLKLKGYSDPKRGKRPHTGDF